MAEISITLGPHSKGSLKLAGWSRALPGQIKKGLVQAGIILEHDMKRKVSGPSHVRNPGVSNPFPGVDQNRLRPSINAQISPDGTQLKVGPNVEYAPWLEYGTPRMPPYPFVGPTWEDKGDDAVRAIQIAIFRPLDQY